MLTEAGMPISAAGIRQWMRTERIRSVTNPGGSRRFARRADIEAILQSGDEDAPQAGAA